MEGRHFAVFGTLVLVAALCVSPPSTVAGRQVPAPAVNATVAAAVNAVVQSLLQGVESLESALSSAVLNFNFATLVGSDAITAESAVLQNATVSIGALLGEVTGSVATQLQNLEGAVAGLGTALTGTVQQTVAALQNVTRNAARTEQAIRPRRP